MDQPGRQVAGERLLRLVEEDGFHVGTGEMTSSSPRSEKPGVQWERTARELELRVTVPDGTTATVALPDGSTPKEAGPGVHSFTCIVRAAHDDPQ